MSMDNLDERKFDETLERALQKHSEPAPPGFTERMMRQIEEAEERRILSRVVLQERLALVGCIAFGAIATIGLTVFPKRIAEIIQSIAVGFTQRGTSSIDRISQIISIETVKGDWRFYTILVMLLGFAVYSLVDMLVGDRLRIRIA